MPKFIVKISDKYFEFSTIVDAFTSVHSTREAFEKYYLERYGTDSKRELDERLERVERTGTSSMLGDTCAWDTICCNRMKEFYPFDGEEGFEPTEEQDGDDTYTNYTLTYEEIVQAIRDGRFDEDGLL